MLFRGWSRVHNECCDDGKNLLPKSEMQVPRVCRPRGQPRAWVPGKQLEKVVDEASELRRSGVAQQGIIRGDTAQSGTVDLFDESVGPINAPDMRTKTDAGSNPLRSSSRESRQQPERRREVGRLRHTLDNRV
jgi:hypothetical protein